MKLFALALAPVLLAFPAFAADLPMVEDADASGAYSLAELQTVWKDLTEDNFMANCPNHVPAPLRVWRQRQPRRFSPAFPASSLPVPCRS